MFNNLSLIEKGLLCAGLGLAGTFLVLVMVYAVIAVMRKCSEGK